jgi:hypothetical protein
LEKPWRENQCSRFGDFIIQQENIEIFLQKSASKNTEPNLNKIPPR